ncbi:hypothetical protein Airi02_007660 [Actinoallomurus iriomotensis]|uniref:Uncharacterized protein n=1 Tax=Actinoallomurus iriomotensis TaxID=478107 RepID=A0A9W6VYH2_9ACTN|nr:hypothetical protein Airi02_007660 [Actinoallomurus iriomotensis]
MAVAPGAHVVTLRDVRCVPGGPAFTGAAGLAAGPAEISPPNRRDPQAVTTGATGARYTAEPYGDAAAVWGEACS